MIQLFKGTECTNQFSEATHGKDFMKVAKEVALAEGLTFEPTYTPKASQGVKPIDEDTRELADETRTLPVTEGATPKKTKK